MSDIPNRLNLAIANRCYISCPGCYQLFGQSAPNLPFLLKSVERFLELGLSKVTISGGDPLTIRGIVGFIDDLRSMGVQEIKLDTVGIGFLKKSKRSSQMELDIPKTLQFLTRVDHLGIPIDAFGDEINHFRDGRPQLFHEIRSILNAISSLTEKKMIVINTVVSNKNAASLPMIYNEILKYKAIHSWNLFQYTPTDLVPQAVNQKFAFSDTDFFGSEISISDCSKISPSTFNINFFSNRSRLGYYLLINSDGKAWLPDERGHTVGLGNVFGREEDILTLWSQHAARLRAFSTF